MERVLRPVQPIMALVCVAFSTTGVLHSLSGPLAEAGISLPSLSMLHAPKAAAAEGRAAPHIAERHTDQERDAVNRLIAHHAEK